MTILIMIFRKLMKNKWIELGLLSGLILAAAMVCTMPIYTDAILQRMLVKDMQHMQQESDQYPTAHWSAAYLSKEDSKNHLEVVRNIDEMMVERGLPTFGLDVLEHVKERVTISYRLQPVDLEKSDGSIRRYAKIGAISDLENHVRLVDGRFPANEPVNGTYEVLVPDRALIDYKMVLGYEFFIQAEGMPKPIKVKPVGVIEKKTNDDVYWYAKSIRSYSSTFLIPFELFERDITEKGLFQLDSSFWYSVMDYSEMNLEHVQQFFQASSLIERELNKQIGNYAVNAPVLQNLWVYNEKEQRLRILLWSLNVPIFIMLTYYLYMVSNLIIERQKQEIAVLKSRGSGRLQIMLIYLIEGIILGAIAMLLGPVISLWFTKLLGASSGFLEFVQRAGLKVRLDSNTYKYALIVTICSLLTMLVPVYLASGSTIVSHKQKMANHNKSSWLHRYFIDLILLGVAFYGWNSFQKKIDELSRSALDSLSMNLDPLTFLVPAIFILGMGLLLLRIYPWVLKLVFWLGRKWWSPSMYATIIQVGRSGKQYQFLMVFLIMTIATGIFSASAARTINQNMEDVINYKNGSDLVLSFRWEDNVDWSMYFLEEQGVVEGDETSTSLPSQIEYKEPPFQPILDLPGVENAAKVFTKRNVDVSYRNINGKANLMGIDTDDFGRTAWFRDGLLDNHLNNYLNLIAKDPYAVLVSRSFADNNGINAGDNIEIGWSNFEHTSFIVYAIIDYFPSFIPTYGDGSETLIIGHLGTIQNRFAIEPYDVWVELSPGASRSKLYEAITAEEDLYMTHVKDSIEEVITIKNDPFHLAINGVMTLGFLIAVLICFLGFLLYWVLALLSRILQTGVFRAMGISFRQIIGMLFMEQVLTSGAAIAIGIVVGRLASYLFVPVFQLSFDLKSQVPPFVVIMNSNDTLRLYIIMTCMIFTAMLILGNLMARIKIHQAVKLGEDQ